MKGILLALAVACAPGVAHAEDCSLKQMASLDMVGTSDKDIIVQVMINGTPRNFLVDTGGVYSELNESVVKELGLHEQPIAGEVYTTYGTLLRNGVTVNSLMLGQNEAKGIRLMVRPDRNDNFDGVLSPDLLQVFDVDIDFAARKLNLFSPEHCEGKVVYWAHAYSEATFKLTDGYHITFEAALDDHEMSAILDTGSTMTWLSTYNANRLFSVDASSPDAEKTDITLGGEPVFRRRFQSLAVSGVKVLNPMIYVRPAADEKAFNREHSTKDAHDAIYGYSLESTPLIFGMNIISKLHVYIAYKEHKLYVTDAGAH
jgi:predicted aspartyl protease